MGESFTRCKPLPFTLPLYAALCWSITLNLNLIFVVMWEGGWRLLLVAV